MRQVPTLIPPMQITSLYDDSSTAGAEKSSAVPPGAIVAVVAGIAAAWIAAGSTGLLGHALRHALTWIALGTAVVAAWPRRDRSLAGLVVLGLAVILGLALTASSVPTVNVLAVAVVTAGLARANSGLTGRAVLLAALAATMLGAFRLAYTTIPAVWLVANATGGAMGRLAGCITGEPLSVGTTFGGLDFLVLMAALYVGWLLCTSRPRLSRAIYAAVAILAGHLLYLIVLSYANKLLAALPAVVVPQASDNDRLGVWAWGNAARTLIPWNLPLLAGVIQATIAAAMFRWATWMPVLQPVKGAAARDKAPGARTPTSNPSPLALGPVLLAIFIPVLTALSLSSSDLGGKRIVAYDQGHQVDWPKSGVRGEGLGVRGLGNRDPSPQPLTPNPSPPIPNLYSMLPRFVESLGGRFVVSPELSEQDLAAADVLLLLHPDKPWPEERLERVWEFVRGGGSLLLVAEPQIHEDDSNSSFNDVLEPTAMRVRYDTAVSATGRTISRRGSWENSLEPSAHPAAAGIGDRRNRFGVLLASSICIGWPACPVLVGRFGYSEPGSDALATLEFQYDRGEKLGDLVLAAEQPMGRGRIVVLADALSLHDEVSANAYTFTGRLLGYLANKPAGPQAWWRQLLGFLAIAGLIGLLAWRADASVVAAGAGLLAVSLVCCTATSNWASRVLPDGRDHSPNNLAYIDASHMEAYSSDTWGEEGIGGLTRVLIRNGYLPLLLPELTRERLERAGLLISIAPARPFSAGERQAVRDFVHGGGSFICMVGAEEVAPCEQLLDQFDFYVLSSPAPPSEKVLEPQPMGFFRTSYFDADDYRAYVQIYAGWEVKYTGPGDQEMFTTLWAGGKAQRPVIICRQFGEGNVTLIGDTYFATNKNLESVDNVLTENVHFWRWLLTRLTGAPEWIPPKPDTDTTREGEAPAEPTGEDRLDDLEQDEVAP